MADLTSPTPVRLVVATDWGVGFQLTPEARPIDDVPPGGEYVTECAPQRPVEIHEVLVHGFQLVQISLGERATEAEIVSGGENRRYRLKPPLPVLVGERVRLRLRNDADVPRKPKSAVLIHDPAATGRPEDAVACPACGKEPGDACDGPTSHPSRRATYEAQPRLLRGHPTDPARVRAEFARLERGAPRCPSCRSSEPELRHGQRLAILIDGVPPPITWCKDAWHDQRRPEPERHAPKIARTLNEGPGNAVLVRGCSCGTEVGSAAAFAAHVGVSADAVRSMLDLAGIADDLLDYHAEMKREDIARQIARCLEFPARTARLRAYIDVERAMMALDDANDPLADALRATLDPIWYALSDAERDFLNQRKVIK